MSAEVKHTPGPWVRSGVRQKIDGQVAHAIVASVDGRDVVIASVWYDPQTHEGFKDAGLIAAAPELLALAHNLQRWLMTDVEPSHIGAEDMRVYHLDGGILSNLLNEARAAIAKAEGRSDG